MNLLDLEKSSSFFSLGRQPKEEGLYLNGDQQKGSISSRPCGENT
jgi:hypothetical protein